MQAIERQTDPLIGPSVDLTERFDELKRDAEIEGISISDKSKEDFFYFMGVIAPMNRPSVFLNDDGCIHARWVDVEGSVGIVFLGDEWAKFTIMTAGSASDKKPRAFGLHRISRVLAVIEAFGADGILA